MSESASPPFGAYLHYPYCRTRCHYCAFNTYLIPDERTLEEYGEALAREIETVSIAEGLAGRTLASVFCGGGTPSVFPTAALTVALDRLRALYQLQDGAEITFEANPGTVTEDALGRLRAAGYNRVSFGAQALQAHLLTRLGRTHGSEDVERSVRAATRAGFDEVSLDLMYGLPGQTVDDVADSVSWALSLGIRHLSAYGLEVEPSTRFGAEDRAGTLVLPPEEEVVAMGGTIDDLCDAAGLRRYEVSNYAVPGHESRHNLLYWQRGEYRGFGPGAHSFLADRRFWNINDPRRYVRAVMAGSSAIGGDETLRLDQAMGEWVYLRLRLVEGARFDDFERAFGRPLLATFAGPIGELQAEGLLEATPAQIRATAQGRWLLNRVVLPFLQP